MRFSVSALALLALTVGITAAPVDFNIRCTRSDDTLDKRSVRLYKLHTATDHDNLNSCGGNTRDVGLSIEERCIGRRADGTFDKRSVGWCLGLRGGHFISQTFTAVVATLVASSLSLKNAALVVAPTGLLTSGKHSMLSF